MGVVDTSVALGLRVGVVNTSVALGVRRGVVDTSVALGLRVGVVGTPVAHPKRRSAMSATIPREGPEIPDINANYNTEGR
jgi:hypothetical protein